MSGVVVVDASNPDRATGRWFVQETGQRAEGTNLTLRASTTTSTDAKTGAGCIMRRRYDPLLRNTGGTVTALPFPTDVPLIG